VCVRKNMGDMVVVGLKTPPIIVDWLLAKTLDYVSYILVLRLQISHIRGKT
jgi:broad-specificity NMP kinase